MKKYYAREYIKNEMELVDSVGRPCEQSDMDVINVWREIWGHPMTRQQEIDWVYAVINDEATS